MVRRILALALVLGPLSLVAWADLPPRPRPIPPPPAEKQAKFVIEVDSNAKAPRLVVPRGLTGRAGLDVEGEDRLTEAGPRTAPVVAGVAVALGLTCGGLWLARRNRTGTHGLALLLAAGGLLTAAALAVANPPPPPRPPVLPQLYDGKVTVEVTPGGDTIRLIIPPDVAAKLGKQPGATAPTGGAVPPAAAKPGE